MSLRTFLADWGSCSKTARGWRQRRGVVLVVFAIFLIALLGMLGFVVDWALLASTYRHAQNAADAAALGAAMDRMRGQSTGTATTTATTFVQTYNGLSNALTPTVNIPPATGPYAGQAGYVEVIVTVPYQTYIAHVIGVARDQQVQARAVAGYEAHSAGEGVAVLDPSARPGLNVSGNSPDGTHIRVNGSVVVNSEGGGVDETGAAMNNGNTGFAASVGGATNQASGIFAQDLRIVGGVDNPDNFKDYDTGLPGGVLHCRQLSEPDPLINLPIPHSNNGVDNRSRGAIDVTGGMQPPDLSGDSSGQNHIAVAGETVPGGHAAIAGEVILYPGIYDSIKITGGTVYLVPGIYVLAPKKNTTNALAIQGGTVLGEGVMFYNTSTSYNGNDGTPDINYNKADNTPLPNTEFAGGITVVEGVRLSPIDKNRFGYGTTFYTGAGVVPTEFDGMLFFQNRRNNASISITGGAGGALSGTLYAKWSTFNISGQGTFDAQFVCGSLAVTGGGRITILSTGGARGRANQIYLVE